MTREPLDRRRDPMANAPHEIDHLPSRFEEARSVLGEALAKMEGAGIPNDTIVTAMLAEMLPHMAHQNDPFLNTSGRTATPHDIVRALRVLMVACVLQAVVYAAFVFVL